MNRLRIDMPQAELFEFCERWKIAEFAFFGSVLRDDFRADSDLDVLISFSPGADWSLLDHIQMEKELSRLLNREIDLFTRRAVEQSHNDIRRQEILGTAEVIYDSRSCCRSIRWTTCW
jgi:hypothetical protein